MWYKVKRNISRFKPAYFIIVGLILSILYFFYVAFTIYSEEMNNRKLKQEQQQDNKEEWAKKGKWFYKTRCGRTEYECEKIAPFGDSPFFINDQYFIPYQVVRKKPNGKSR